MKIFANILQWNPLILVKELSVARTQSAVMASALAFKDTLVIHILVVDRNVS